MAKGIDVRATTSELLFRVFLQDSGGAILATGTTSLYLYELQMGDGTLKSYDFSDNTFKATALTTETAAMTHRTGNNGTTSTGVWTYRLATLTGFTAGNVYFVRARNTGASPADQVREFQFGSDQGDLAVTAAGYLKADVEEWKGAAAPAMTGDAYARLGPPAGATIAADLVTIAGYIDTEVAAIKAQTDKLTFNGSNQVSGTVADKTGFSLASSGLDAVVVEAGLNARQALAINSAALAGVLSGAGTTTITILGAGVVSTRIVATVDASGDRIAVVLTPPA